MNYLRLVIAVLLVSTLAACAGPGPIKAADANRIKRVGVVSLIGDRLFRQSVGILVFGNSSEWIDISGWEVDSHTESVVVQAIEGDGRMRAVSLGSDRRALMDIYGPRTLSESGDSAKLPRISKTLGDIAKRENLDAFVLVVESIRSGFAAKNQPVQGLTFWSGHHPTETWLLLLSNVIVVDANGSSILQANWVHRRYGSPDVEGEQLRCSDTQRILSERDLVDLRPIAMEIIDRSVPVTVKGILNPESVPLGSEFKPELGHKCVARWDGRPKAPEEVEDYPRRPSHDRP